jgi:hypothetical protein
VNLGGLSVVIGLLAVTAATWPYGAPLLLLLWWVWRRS